MNHSPALGASCKCDRCKPISKEEWEAIYDAVMQVDDEFGFKIGEGKSMRTYMETHPEGYLDDYYEANRTAYSRGADLIEKIKARCQ